MTLYLDSQCRIAVPYFKQSAESDYPAAYLYMFLIYRTGIGVYPSRDKSDLWRPKVAPHAEWFKKQAQTGQAEAQLNLGICYEYGLGVQHDRDLAFQTYKLAAVQGNAAAQYRMGTLYQSAGVPRGEISSLAHSRAIAVDYYNRAALQGFALAETELGRYYLGDWGRNDGTDDWSRHIKQDVSLALKFLYRAADRGDARAQFLLAKCYHDRYDNRITIMPDSSLALKYYYLAAAQGWPVPSLSELEELNKKQKAL
jgi:TPR repeat protein